MSDATPFSAGLLLAIELAPGSVPAGLTLPVESAALLADCVAADLARLVPDVERAGLAISAACYDQAQVLRPGYPMFDALGSMAVGVLLIVVAILLSMEIKALITGESAEAGTKHAIHDFLAGRNEIAEVYSLLTLQMGEGIMLAIKARMKETDSATAMIDDINRVEADLRVAFPAVRWCFFEPDDKN